MTDMGKMARPDLLLAGGGALHGPLGPLAAYLSALETRVRALEAQLSASTLMTTADAAQYTRVGVETILRAIRSGDLPAAGYVGRSPRISRDAVDDWIAKRSPPTAPASLQRRRSCGRKASETVEAAWRELG